MAGAGYRVSFEAFVNSEAKDERITRSQAALHLGERLNQSLIAHGGMLRPFRVAGSGRFGFEPGNKNGHIASGQAPCLATVLIPSRSMAPASVLTVPSMTRSL